MRFVMVEEKAVQSSGAIAYIELRFPKNYLEELHVLGKFRSIETCVENSATLFRFRFWDLDKSKLNDVCGTLKTILTE